MLNSTFEDFFEKIAPTLPGSALTYQLDSQSISIKSWENEVYFARFRNFLEKDEALGNAVIELKKLEIDYKQANPELS